MKNQILFFIAWSLCTQAVSAQYNYPATKTVDSVDTYWGVTVPDPYRWLENLKDSSVIQWFKAQANYTNEQLAKISGQDKLIQEMKTVAAMNTGTYSPIAKAGGKYFYEKILPGEQARKLYYKKGKDGNEVLLFDPQKYIAGKTMDYTVNVCDDGSKVLLNLSEAGAEISDIRILNVATRTFLPDSIPHIWGGVFVGGSNMEITYSQAKNYDVHDPKFKQNLPYKLHVIGTPVASDIVIASSEKNPDLVSSIVAPYVYVYKDCPYIFMDISSVERNLTLYYAPKSELKSEIIHWKPLTTKADEVKQFFVHGKDVYFFTSKGNPKFKITKTDLENPDVNHAAVIVEGKGDWEISNVLFAQTKDYLVFNESKDEMIVKPYSYEFKTGKISEINTSLKGNVYGGIPTNDETILSFSKEDNEIVLTNSGWTTPFNFYNYNIQTKQLSDNIFTAEYSYPNLENLTYEEVEVPSYDGTLVPLSIMYDKNKLKKNGSNICFMRGYGAYGITYPPVFSGAELILLNRGVVLTDAHVRGGGEKGNEWHIAGMKTTKPNTWKDFNACAEWLIKHKYTSPEKFGAEAVSAGGILIGRAITERPDLYKVAISKVGWLNMIRTEFSPNGPANIPEFGTVKDSVEFKALLEMDAYQHIQKGVKYPAQLITTGWNDQRVSSYFPAKYAAKMQEEYGSGNPVFLSVNYAGGHFGGSTMDEQYTQLAQEFAFLLWQCGDSEFQVK